MYLTNSTKEGRYLSQFDKIHSAKSNNNKSRVAQNKLTNMINNVDEKMKRLENDNQQELSKQKKETFESLSNKMEGKKEEQTQLDILMARIRLLEEKLNILTNYKNHQLNFIISSIKFKDFKIGDDSLEWLNNSLHKLKFYRLPQDDKLKVLQALLPSPLLEWSHKIDNETPNLNYDSFITKLIEMINSSALVEKKERAFKNSIYSEKEEGIQFLEKVRNLLKAVEPNYTKKRLFDAIRNTLPADIDRQVTKFRVRTVEHLTDINYNTRGIFGKSWKDKRKEKSE